MLLSVSFCSSSEKRKLSGKSFPYDLSEFDTKITLPQGLTEISGIAWYRNDTILGIQDEKARVYVIDLRSAEAASHFNFGKDGDFEDLAVINDSILALRSDGKIYEMGNFNAGPSDVKVYSTPLTSLNNTEGFAWDKLSNSLLIACKGAESPEKTKTGHKKAIYRYNPETKKMAEEPAYVINLKDPDDYSSPDILTDLEAVAKKNHIKIEFLPSGISVHPLTGEIYVLSRRLLLILNRQGKIINFSFLEPTIFSQPEGICFSPSGDLYISSEGRGGNGYILKFNAPGF
jgi:uncharacterized protein YjiK